MRLVITVKTVMVVQYRRWHHGDGGDEDLIGHGGNGDDDGDNSDGGGGHGGDGGMGVVVQ